MKLCLIALGLIATTSSGTLYIAKSTVPESALSLPAEDMIRTTSFVPQGWAFFTKSPLEPTLTVWKETSSGWHRSDRGANAEVRNAAGWNRAPRADAIRLGEVMAMTLEQMPDGAECQGHKQKLATCVQDVSPVSVTMPAAAAPFCGKFAVVSQEPQPWVWANRGLVVDMPRTAWLITARCHRD